MKINDMKGDYKNHKFWSSRMYYVHAGIEYEGEQKSIRESKKNAIIYVSSKENPEIYVEISEIKDYVAMDVCLENNFFYVRYKYKTEVLKL